MLTRDPKVLLKPGTWLFLAKLSVVLTAEVAVAPVALSAVALERWIDPRKTLQVQNLMRRKALLWLFPEFGPKG